jgi:hypothetical protein
MSSTYSAVSADLVSDLKLRECAPSHFASAIASVRKCSGTIGQVLIAIQISANSMPANIAAASMSSAADSPVKTSALWGNARESADAKAGYGQNFSEPFGRYDHDSSSWRTLQCSLIRELESLSETWPRSGMTRSGIAYQLRPLVPLTSEIGRGLLPTPRKSRGFTNPTLGKSRSDCLTTRITGRPILGTRPHPNFVEWMMGYPIGWTELEPSVTQSCIHWPSHNDDASRKKE